MSHAPRSLADLAEMADRALFHDLLHDVSPTRVATAIGGAAMLAAPALAGDGAFVALVMDAGKLDGGLGEPIASSTHIIYQHPQGKNFPPSAEAIAETPDLEYDSYVALGGAPSTFGYTGRSPWMTFGGGETSGFFAPAFTPINNRDMTGPLGHLWFAPGVYAPPGSTVYSNTNSGSGLQSVFVARLTVPRGAALTAPKIYVGVQTLESSTLAGYLLTLNGPAQFFPIFTNSTPPPEATFRLHAYRTAQPTIADFGAADVYDVYVEAIPTTQAVTAPPPPPAPAPNHASQNTSTTSSQAHTNNKHKDRAPKPPKPPKRPKRGRH